ncbi:MAG: DUF2950 domain-containing protein, partial [Burkholderiaceae bacterium]
ALYRTVVVTAFALASFTAAAQQVFNTPDDAVNALVAAAKSNDEAALMQLAGPKGRDVLGTVDKARDRELRSQFAAAATEYRRLDSNNDGSMTLVVGSQWWPLPIPLVRSGTGWRFDIDAGRKELVNRRIGANELEAMSMLYGFVDAQRHYAVESRDGSGVRAFARKLVSTPGRKDGLYWKADASKGDRSSSFAALIGEPGTGDAPMLRNGYRYRILTAQGASAPGGAYSYLINGRLLAGFALLAYPAEYRKTGVMTFIVNHYGDIYEKDLGAGTATAAAKIMSYAPDSTWNRVDDF